MKHTFTWQDTAIVLDIAVEDDFLRVTLPDGTDRVIQARRLSENEIEIHEGNRVFRVCIVSQMQGAVTVGRAGESYIFERATESGTRRTAERRKSSGTLTAPMAGVVAAVLVEAGAHVDSYQPIAVVEAMKVLATVEAPFAGTVESVAVHPGEAVRHGQVLVEIVPEKESAG